MRIATITLENIRSYTHAHLEFPAGSVILCGDIGSGKSTILLAIEFALFGILRGELSGNALLRNGCMRGSAELTFFVDNEKYTIKRTLKRTKNSVEQESGYLIHNDVKTEGTAIELKSKILEILSYSQETLTKSKNFVYRYTVYTPQEEMKKIILEAQEDRIALLRRVFDIDKYSRITQNVTSYAKLLRERKRANDALVLDCEEKKKQAETVRFELSLAKEQFAALSIPLESLRAQLIESRKKVYELELQKKQQDIITRELHITRSQMLAKEQLHTTLQKEAAELLQKINVAQQEISTFNIPELSSSDHITSSIQENETLLRNSIAKKSESITLKRQALQLIDKISILAQCPTCFQQVGETHKQSIILKEQQTISALDMHLLEQQMLVKKSEEDIILLRNSLEIFQKQQRDIAIMNLKKNHLEQNLARQKSIAEQVGLILQEKSLLAQKSTLLEKQILEFSHVIASYDLLRNNLDGLIAQERTMSISHSVLQQKISTSKNQLTLLDQEVERKERIKKQLEKTHHVHQWITDYFVPLMDIMEKHVMIRIHHEFNALFAQWFSMLVDDTMTARLDETFTPIISQNGYDTDVEHLSGGERTACALAYRLALNKTINSLLNTIRTKDLLILDEPTEGFSSEQLDKMRDVLAQLSLLQIIIVSHEQKIEGFADHVIRLQKNEHVTSIVS